MSRVHILVALRMRAMTMFVDAAGSASTLMIVVIVMVVMVTSVRAWRGHR
jgi:hypothetical protein